MLRHWAASHYRLSINIHAATGALSNPVRLLLELERNLVDANCWGFPGTNGL